MKNERGDYVLTVFTDSANAISNAVTSPSSLVFVIRAATISWVIMCVTSQTASPVVIESTEQARQQEILLPTVTYHAESF